MKMDFPPSGVDVARSIADAPYSRITNRLEHTKARWERHPAKHTLLFWQLPGLKHQEFVQLPRVGLLSGEILLFEVEAGRYIMPLQPVANAESQSPRNHDLGYDSGVGFGAERCKRVGSSKAGRADGWRLDTLVRTRYKNYKQQAL